MLRLFVLILIVILILISSSSSTAPPVLLIPCGEAQKWAPRNELSAAPVRGNLCAQYAAGKPGNDWGRHGGQRRVPRASAQWGPDVLAHWRRSAARPDRRQGL